MSLPVLVAVVFSLGIAAAGWLRQGFGFYYSAGIIFFIICLIFSKRRYIFGAFLILAFFALGMSALKNSVQIPVNDVSVLAYYKNGRVYVVSGMVKSEGVRQDGGDARFLLKAGSVQWGNLKYKCSGLVLVRMKSAKRLSYGDEVILTGALARPYSAYGAFDYRGYLNRQGVHCLMNAKLAAIKRSKGSLAKTLFTVKRKAEGLIINNLSPLGAGIVLAMLFGERSRLSPAVNHLMVKTGTVHVLVVSGFNVGIVAFIVLLMLKVLRVKRKARCLAAILILCAYCLITGASNPVLRATIMGIFILLGRLLDREPNIYNSLSCAWLAILIISPGQLRDIGFQLSFASSVAIVLLSSRLNALFRIERIRFKFIKSLLQGAGVSLSAWLGTAGIIFYNFGIFSPVTVFANIFIVPLATLITLCGFALISAGSLIPWLAKYIGISAEFLVGLLLRFNAWAASLPGACLYLKA